MNKSKVFFYPVDDIKSDNISQIARILLEKIVTENKIHLEKEIPLKVCFGEEGNVTYIKPENFKDVIAYLHNKKIHTYFVETNSSTGARSLATTHTKIAIDHGFTQLPIVIADGEQGFDHEQIPVHNCKHFKSCKIAKKLANLKQVIVMSHFKGHVMSGFGGAIKMLGIGFASGRGKVEAHTKKEISNHEQIDWSNGENLYTGALFRERSAEYALAAVNKKPHIYLNFAIDIVKDCDCDGRKMTPIYKDLGVFASTDPVAIDKACFDMLEKREAKIPFFGDDIFDYAEKIGLGSKLYQIIKCDNSYL